MANSLNNTTFQQYWSRRMQRKHQKEAIYRAIANFEEQKILKQGDTVHRPYRSGIVAQSYTRGTAVTIQDLTNTDETLVVNTAEVVPFYIDDLDQLQSNYRFINDYADDAGIELTNFIDSDILGEYTNASSIIDDAALNPQTGVSGNGVYATGDQGVSNIQKIFALAKAKLGRVNVRRGLFAVISPDVEQALVNYLAGKNSNLGDSTGLNGHIGKYYGFDLYVSNNLTFTATLGIATQPTDGDTVTIKQYDRNGVLQTVTFTFKTTLGSTAGNVLIGANAASANTNLAALLTTPGTTTSTGVALSAANQAVLFRITSTSTATTTPIVAKGASFFQLSSSLTATGDGWGTGGGPTTNAPLQLTHCIFGAKGATDVVIQQMPKTEIKEVQDKLGKNILPWTLYGFKTFNEGKAMLIDVKVRTDLLS